MNDNQLKLLTIKEYAQQISGLSKHTDFVNITLHNFLKKFEFFESVAIFTERSGVNIATDSVELP